MKKKIFGIVICILVIATALPAVGTMNNTVDKKTTTPFALINNPIRNMEQSFFQDNCVVWDNNGYGITSYHAQDDPPEVTVQWDSFEADDFQFDEDTDVYWVWWPMTYWNCNPVGGPKDYHYDWNITFYNDDGTGNRPGTVFAGPFTFADTDIFKSREIWNLTDVANGYWAAYMSVLFPEPVTFHSEIKYWISIYSIGPHYPQSGWWCHNGSYGYPIKLHEGVFKSAHWGYPDWTDFTIVYGQPLDMIFILGGELHPFEVTLEKGLGITATIKNQLPESYNQTNITVTFTAIGGFVLTRTKSFLIEELNVSAIQTRKFYPIGIGRITVEVIAISQDSAAVGLGKTSGFLFLFFIL